MIHWFPGHMHKATKELKKIMPKIDIAIEVVDARAPEASANPTLQEVAEGKPIIKILSKTDFADPSITKSWLQFYHGKALALDIIKDKKSAQKIIQLCKKSLPNRGTVLKPIRAIIFGVPNVGKSTLINTLAKRKIAKTGNEPAVTKQQQKIEIEKHFYLSDTPGIMFPSPKDEAAGFKLGVIGSIRDTAMDYPSTAYYLIEYLNTYYPGVLQKRYQVSFDESTQEDVETMFLQIGDHIGQQNIHHIAEKIIQDCRHGRLGRVSLETPDNYYTPEAEETNQGLQI
ncbi:ribosome biogenesis GTPase YlqF [Fangia hongkongensis]|uniref:ribosome biogenesis GTPase YlqF n=1 Tax=Fangia hongkongensis TaxID=270495 RepID=UPI000366133F|nr:ribosome biogenesis GTPase YlqF [Fangia hongkongensis]MBK2125452.1 ribosome biogenesis GTPase YlqF [Fangia hongkongensis]